MRSFAPAWNCQVPQKSTKGNENLLCFLCRFVAELAYGVTRKMPHSPLSNWNDD